MIRKDRNENLFHLDLQHTKRKVIADICRSWPRNREKFLYNNEIKD